MNGNPRRTYHSLWSPHKPPQQTYKPYRKPPFAGTVVTARKYGFLIGKQADSDWLQVVPWGLKKLLLYIQNKYDDPEIYITESGVDVPKESSLPLETALKDQFRIDYFQVASSS